MKMSVSKKELNMLIGLLGVAVAVLVWFLVASPYMDKTNALKAENETLKPKAEEYEAANARLDEYELGMIANQNEFNTIVDRFPSEVQIEDLIMFWANIDKAYPDVLRFKDIEIEEPDPVAVAAIEDLNGVDVPDSGVVSDEELEQIEAGYKLYELPEGLNFICTYEGLKKIFSYLEAQNNRCSINQLEVEYDEETGALTGSLWINQFYLEGTDKEYSPVFIPAVPKGQANLFHTSTIPLDELIALTDEEKEELLERDIYGTKEDIVENTDSDDENEENEEDEEDDEE